VSILVVGSIAYDAVKTPYGKVDKALGGSATYFSSAATHFTPVRVVGVVGNDFDKKAYAFLKRRGADLSGIQVMNGKTFFWRGEYSDDMNEAKTLSTCLNVFEHFSPLLSPAYRKSSYIFLGNIDPDLQMKVLDQINRPRITALDTMNLWINIKPDSLKKAISRVNLVIMNNHEAISFTQKNNLVCAAKAISEMGPGAVIVKKGEHGAYLRYGKKQFVLPAFPLEKVVDPTGAGDSFAGGVMGYLSTCKNMTFQSLKRAMIYGTLMASFNVEKFSVDRLKYLKKNELGSRYKEFLKIFKV